MEVQGGPSEHRLLGNERIINFWPARSGPVIADGIVYFTAGIWPQHGVFIYTLNAESGEVEWVNDTTSSDYVSLPHGGAKGHGGLAPQGYPAVDGDRLVVAGGRTPPAFSVQPYFFSLVISEDAPAAGIGADEAVFKKVLNLLRPYGGTAWLRAGADEVKYLTEAASAAAVDQVSVWDREDHLFAQRSGPLTGAGQWTHQYHDPRNTNLSFDDRVRLPLGILWFGGPNNHNILPRHGAGPKPQIAGGRQVFLGVETIAARCVFTGRQLWEREFPGIGHPFTKIDREEKWSQGQRVMLHRKLTGVAYIGSPFVTLQDSIYLRHEGKIHRLDPRSGKTKDVFVLPVHSPAQIESEKDAPDWGHMSVQGDSLITTAKPHIFEDQELGWRERDQDLGWRGYSGT